jgi:hypothetical protein
VRELGVLGGTRTWDWDWIDMAHSRARITLQFTLWFGDIHKIAYTITPRA